MKKTNEYMKKIHKKSMEDLGIRFLLFRKAIKKSRPQLATELGIRLSELTAIEKGTTYPKINYLHYLNRRYGLNINWMVGDIGEMFIKDRPLDIELDPDYAASPSTEADDSRHKKILEFFQLMQIPVIEEAIMTKFKELIELLKKQE